MSTTDRPSRTKTIRFAVAILVQVAIIAAVIGVNAATVAQGRSVYLKIMPIDPRDPLRGDYLAFTYEISELDVYYFDRPPKAGDPVYVQLQDYGAYCQASSAFASRPDELSSETVYIKGTVDYVYGEKARIAYGIEEYFVPEGVANDFPFREEAAARVIVDDSGNAVLRQLYVDGDPWP